MASFKTPENYGYEIAELFQSDPALITKAKALGVTIKQPSAGTFVFSTGNGKTHSTIQVKGAAISLAKSGTIGPGSLDAMKGQFDAGLKKSISAAEADGVKPAQFPPTKNPPQSLNPASAFPFPTPQAAPAKTYNPGILGADSLIKLHNATDLYQGVSATTAGSVYNVFALGKGINFACRIKGQKLSIRIEGSALAPHTTRLISEYKMEASKAPDGVPYLSGHFTGLDKELIRKTLGAIIGSVGYHNMQQVANFDMLKESV